MTHDFPDFFDLEIFSNYKTMDSQAQTQAQTRQFVPRFDQTPDQIAELTQTAIQALNQLADELAQVPLDSQDCNFDRIVRQPAQIWAKWELDMDILLFLQHVSTDEGVREASRVAEQKWNEFCIELSQREDLYLRLKKVAELSSADDSLDEIDHRLLAKNLRDYRRMGLELAPEPRAELKEILNRHQELGIEFSKNIGEDKSCLYVKSDELTGLAQDFLDRTAKAAQEQAEKDGVKYDGNHKLTAQYPDVFPVMEFCQVAETRKRVTLMFEARAQNNLPLLKEMLELRQRRADLLDYPNNVAFQTEVLMTQTEERVRDFLESILRKLSPGAQKYVAELTELKRADLRELSQGQKGENSQADVQLEYWDYSYYHQKYLQQHHQLDHQKLKEYFPTDYVCDEMFKIYSEIFSLVIEEREPPHQWFDSNRYYQVRDRESNRVLGHFYMDLYPREGKYSHAAAWSMVGYREQVPSNPTSQQVLPMGCLVCNFTAPTEDQPSLLTYQQVTTFFHEFGHIIHGICGGYQNRYSDFSGTHVERDFVEAPSQMIEQWLWEPVVLRRITKHFRTNDDLPADLLDRLVASRYVGKARDWTRQAVLSLTDHRLHLKGDWASEEDMMATYREISDRFMGYPCGTGKALASWGHLGGGYDARYYSYIWSRVIACDLYGRFEDSGNPLDPECGLAYRRLILEPGGNQDGLMMVQNYLGREMKQDAFLKSMGVQVSPASE